MLRNIETVWSIGTTQTVAVTGVSAQTTNGVSTYVNAVRLLSTTDCYIAIGSNPTATTSSMLLQANVAENFRIRPGEKVAVLEQLASGTLYVTELTH